MISEQKIDSVIAKEFETITFGGEPRALYDPLGYMIAIGGKRLRPKLCLLAYSLYKDSFSPEVLDAAKALEVFHSYTLIHDDIMDKSLLRRGVATVWDKWGENEAILSGDVMCIDSFSRIASLPNDVMPDALNLFTTTARQVCEGQQYDMDFESKRVSMDEYMTMIGLKTAVLLACSMKMGALLAQASENDQARLYEYGYKLGLAFQVADDYLDAYGDAKVFGKPIGGDILNGKQSWLTVKAFELADSEAVQSLETAFALPSSTQQEKDAKILAVKSLYDTLGVPESAKQQIVDLTDEALRSAAAVMSGVRYESLKRLAAKLIARSK